MSRTRLLCLALSALCVLPAAGQVLPGPSPTPVLPLAGIENWLVLQLQGGILYTRVDGAHDAPYFVFAARAGDEVSLLAYRGGADAPGAFGALADALALSSRDVATLKAFTVDNRLGLAGTWDALTFGDAYLIAADPSLGTAGPRLHDALLLLEAGEFASRLIGAAAASSKDEVEIDLHACVVQQWTANEATSGGGVASATGSGSGGFPKVRSADATSTKAFKSAASRCVAADRSPHWGTPPAFPVVVPPAVPFPAGPVHWAGQSCQPVGGAQQCIDQYNDQLCDCTCQEDVGSGTLDTGTLVVTGACRVVTPLPVGTACLPIDGYGPCTRGAKLCRCQCQNTSPPGATGVWGSPACGSAEIAAAFLLLAGGLAWRRRLA